MPKRIVLLLDGTWNDADFGTADTNVVRLRELIASCLDRDVVGNEATTPASSPHQSSVSRRTFTVDRQTTEYLVFYERGVGTGGFLDNIKGGAFGAGLGRNIRRAYLFLAKNYEPGDEIFLFGFSRGSYTARSLVGYLGAVGLLRIENCDAANESRAWYYYRTNPLDRLPVVKAAIREATQRIDIRIKAMCLFDTVGALGVPVAWLRRENRDLFEFHDVGLSGSCDLSLHALAIDEHRESFEATLWRQPKFGSATSKVEQVWFSGSHSDIGGGYLDAEDRRSADTGIDDLPLDWMIRRLLAAHPEFPVRRLFGTASDGLARVTSLQHEARRHFYLARPLAYRSIGNDQRAPEGWWTTLVSQDRHNPPLRESVHVSAIERLGRCVPCDSSTINYAPQNLVRALDAIDRTYTRPATTRETLHVEGWDAERLSADEAMRIVANARERLRVIGDVLRRGG